MCVRTDYIYCNARISCLYQVTFTKNTPSFDEINGGMLFAFFVLAENITITKT